MGHHPAGELAKKLFYRKLSHTELALTLTLTHYHHPPSTTHLSPLLSPLSLSLLHHLAAITPYPFHTANMSKGKVCLAYSGGLDTSCILKYLLVSPSSQTSPSPWSSEKAGCCCKVVSFTSPS